MDVVADAVCGYVAQQRTRELARPATLAAQQRLLDSLSCAVAAAGSPPAVVARSLARRFGGSFAGTVIGSGGTANVDVAAFANTVMVRYLDCNDTYFTRRGGGGHPSDLIPTALAVGEAVGATGAEILRAIAIGYEINGALASAVWLRERGWDQGLNVIAAASMMAGALLELTEDQLHHALALAVTPHVPVRQTRIGHLSMWKGSATAGAVRDGIFAALLAQHGMTGPPEPYVGRSGIWELVSGEFEVTLPVLDDRSVVEDTAIKMRPAEFNAQAAIDLALGLRDSVDLDRVSDIEVSTYFLAVHEIGSDPAKWDPRNRETADHSLPYLIAVALVDGRVDRRSCSPERVLDPGLRPLMQKIKVVEDPGMTARFPQSFDIRITVRRSDGDPIVRQATHPVGHPSNPATAAQFEAKLDDLTRDLSAADRDSWAEMRAGVAALPQAADVSAVLGPISELDIAVQADSASSAAPHFTTPNSGAPSASWPDSTGPQ